MKKIIILLALVASINSCAVIDVARDMTYSTEFSGHNLYYIEEFETLHTYEEIAKWIKAHVQYNPDDDAADISDPSYTLAQGKGSCADFSILFVNIAYFALGEKLDIVLLQQDDMSRHIVSGGSIDHATPYDGSIIDVYTGKYVSAEKIGFLYHFDDIFN